MSVETSIQKFRSQFQNCDHPSKVSVSVSKFRLKNQKSQSPAQDQVQTSQTWSQPLMLSESLGLKLDTRDVKVSVSSLRPDI